jgi:hypothetical protein
MDIEHSHAYIQAFSGTGTLSKSGSAVYDQEIGEKALCWSESVYVIKLLLTQDIPMPLYRTTYAAQYWLCSHKLMDLWQVDFVTDHINCITPTGIETVDSKHREFDIIICVTGLYPPLLSNSNHTDLSITRVQCFNVDTGLKKRIHHIVYSSWILSTISQNVIDTSHFSQIYGQCNEP